MIDKKELVDNLTEEQLKLLYNLKTFHPHTYEHSINVSNVAVEIGEKLNLSKNDLETLQIAGLYHDIGKLLVPQEILHKKGRLTDEEYEIVKKHPENSYNLMIRMGFTDTDLLNAVKYHHERVDGKGYPAGLSKSEIPFLAKILTVADAYDAMTQKRAYKESQNLAYISNELYSNSGLQFESYIVDNFMELLREKEKGKHIPEMVIIKEKQEEDDLMLRC